MPPNTTIVDVWKNVPRESPFNTLALWPGTTVSKDDEIEEFFMSNFNTRIKRVGCVPVKSEIREHDFAFFVHDDDILTFASKRMKYVDTEMFCRWWEDIYFNKQEDEFPEEFCRCYPE